MNPWHDVEIGNKAPDEVDCIIEVPKFSSLKYELDKDTGLLRLDRALYSAVFYPGNYGFIPKTLWEDGDPLDILVLHSQAFYPLTLVNVRPIGVMQMFDNGESDDKILAVVVSDPRFKEVEDIYDLPEHTLKEVEYFFETYKALQGKKVHVLKTRDAKTARDAIIKGMKQYKEEFSD
jgi:inorganic pyrophosphatase